MSRLFISYSRADGEFVLRLAGDLRAAGVDLWLDQEDIPPGARWDRAVEEAMKAAPSLLVVLSPVSAASQNVLDEVSYALDTGKRIIPILYQTCDIPFRLRRLQYVDFTGNYGEALAELVQAIVAREHAEPALAMSAAAPGVSAPAPAAPPIDHPPPPVATRKTPSRGGYVYAILAAVVVIVGVVAYLVFGSASSATDSAARTRPPREATPPSPEPAPPPASAATTTAAPGSMVPPLRVTQLARFAVKPCGAIHDRRTNLEWLIGPDRNLTWKDAERWTGELTRCNGGWLLPNVRQLQQLYDPDSTAGTGYSTGGQRFPAHLDPVFAAIGGGTWVWAADASGALGRTFNFNQGVIAETRRTNTQLAIRAFAVRRAR
jgi:hypothetical protein